MRLSDLSHGDVATVLGFAAQAAAETSTRFRALGFVVGTKVTIDRRLPFHGPIVVRFGGAAFALDHEAAGCIRVTKDE